MVDKYTTYPYALYLGSFRSRERAEKAIIIFNKKGISPYLVKVDFKEKGIWFRVYAGYFKDIAQAARFKIEQGLSKAAVKKTYFANLLGVDLPGKNFTDKIWELQELGYSPYVIKDPSGKSSLYVGAFLTKEGADGQFQELKSKGIVNRIVNR